MPAKALVQGCTFNQEDLHVRVGPGVTSAILTANQAAGGFRFENYAGARTQSALNEADPIQWTKAARAHYRLEVGAAGDGRYLQGWHGAERVGRSLRWSQPQSRLLLPVVPGKRYTLTLEGNVPAQAVSPEAGLYLDGRRILALSAGVPLTATLPPPRSDRIRLELRCQGWAPRQVLTGSGDVRTLGVQVFTITMRAAGATAKVFNANTGQWR